MFRPRAVLAFLWLLLVFPPFTHAATYYVSPAGNDLNTGSATTPWSTVQKCANTLVSGDVCLVGNGVYVEDVRVSRSGSNGQPLRFKSASPYGAVVRGQFYVSGSYVTIEGFKVLLKDASKAGITLAGNQSEVRRTYISTDSTALGLNNTALGIIGTGNRAILNRIDRVCFGISVRGRDHLIDGNDISALKLNGSCGDVDYIRFFGSGLILRNNTLHGISKAEVGSAHVDCFQTYDNPGPDYSVTDVLIEGNFCSDASQGFMMEAKVYRQSRGVTIRNNVISRVGAWCAVNHDVADVRFLNNTCDTTGALHGLWCRGSGGTASCEFKNNIIYGPGTLYGVMETATLIDGNAAAPGKNNLVFKPGKTITGLAADVKNVDPQFVDRDGSDYRLAPTSPAIDAGLTLTTWSTPVDKDDVPRPQEGSWDIGAYEWQPCPITEVRFVP